MDIGLTLPSFVRGADRAAILEWCRRVDEGPFASISVGERIAYPSHELVATLAFAAAATERVRIVSTVAVLPIHDPVRFAKQMATIDVLSDGRLTVGVGVGGRDQDYAALGVPFEGRFARLDEQVDVMQRVWRGEVVVDGLPPIGPVPVQAGGPPLLTAAMGPEVARPQRAVGRRPRRLRPRPGPGGRRRDVPPGRGRVAGGAGRSRAARGSRPARGSRSETAHAERLVELRVQLPLELRDRAARAMAGAVPALGRGRAPGDARRAS